MNTETQSPTKHDQPDNTKGDGATAPANGKTSPKEDPENQGVTEGRKDKDSTSYNFEQFKRLIFIKELKNLIFAFEGSDVPGAEPENGVTNHQGNLLLMLFTIALSLGKMIN